MRTKIMSILISMVLVAFSISVALTTLSQPAQADPLGRDTDFYLAWPYTYFGWFGDPEEQGAQIIIESETSTRVKVTGAASWVGTVSPGSPKALSLPTSAEITTNMVVERKGIHVTSRDVDLSVQFRVPKGIDSSEDMYLAIPTRLLGKEYYAISHGSRAFIGDPQSSEFVIIGTQDGTSIVIRTLSGPHIFIGLNEGDTWQYQLPGDDVTGTYITSDKPIAVIAGVSGTEIPSMAGYADAIFEQMIPVKFWGRDYYTAPLLSPESEDVIRIMASEFKTTVTVNDGVTSMDYDLALPGSWIEIERESAAHITSNKPIGVVQYAKSYTVAGEGDPFEMLIIPTPNFRSGYRFYIPDGYDIGDPDGGAGSFITIIVPVVGTSITVDGFLISPFWSSLPGGGEYSQIILSPGEHTITADHPVGVYCHGYKYAGSYGYPAGFVIHSFIIPTRIELRPRTLNLVDVSRWFTSIIELPEGYDEATIDPSTVSLKGNIPAEKTVLTGHSLNVKFDRAALEDILSPGENVVLTVNGQLTDGTEFSGSDSIRVIDPGK